MPDINVQFPPAFQPLFRPKRYKVFWGGRGGVKSWSFARALLLRGVMQSTRVLCVRELQTSLAESVHKTLADQIEGMGLGQYYEIQRDKILGSNGTSFSFEGIKNNSKKIKSYEGIDVCWVEEANNVSKASWNILIPTIRKEGSEIWIGFNPELEKDYTYQRFVKDQDLRALPSDAFAQPITTTTVFESPMSYVVKTTYRDNPWFPSTLMDEMEKAKKDDYEEFLNVWEGQCRVQLEGAVYGKQLAEAQLAGRIGKVPWDPNYPVRVIFDLGRADKTSIWFEQKIALQSRVIDFYEGSGTDFSEYLKVLQAKPYFYSLIFLPHDGRARVLGSKQTIQEQAQAAFPGQVRIVPKQKIADRLNATRLFLRRCWIDEDNCTDGLAHLRHYTFAIKDGQRSDEPKHDEHSHAADAFGYMAQSEGVGDQEVDPQELIAKLASGAQAAVSAVGRAFAAVGGPQGWMGQ